MGAARRRHRKDLVVPESADEPPAAFLASKKVRLPGQFPFTEHSGAVRERGTLINAKILRFQCKQSD